MTDWFVYMVEQERRRDEIERAAAHHYARRLAEHTDATFSPPRRHEIILAALGDRLVEWGYRLQRRYRRLAQSTNSMASESLLAQQKADSAGCA